MLSCEELDGFLDQLCDLTREMDPLARIDEANRLLDLIDQVPHRFVMQWRAAAAADYRYLAGGSMRAIGRALDLAHQGVAQWLNTYGPTHYVGLVRAGDEPVRAFLLPVTGDDTKAEIRRRAKLGWRFVPAVRNLLDIEAPHGVRPGTDLEELWLSLEPERKE